jgi:hypothetical protein
MLVRMLKIVLIGAFFVGRLDTPLFAPGVGNIGPVRIDSHPIQFRKDLLVSRCMDTSLHSFHYGF